MFTSSELGRNVSFSNFISKSERIIAQNVRTVQVIQISSKSELSPIVPTIRTSAQIATIVAKTDEDEMNVCFEKMRIDK